MSKRGKPPNEAEDPASAPTHRGAESERMAARHLRFGWSMLVIFASLGIALESLHGFKLGWYVDVTSETRRHMWTLAHAHGTLLALVHVAFAASIGRLNVSDSRWRDIASPCLYCATLTLPTGFFLGGTFIYSGDPGMGILLVPVGGFLLVIAALLIALAVRPPP